MEYSNNDDGMLISLSAQGDEQAFEQLIRRYQHAVFSMIYRYVGDHSSAEDLAQEIFIKVWRNAAGFQGKSKFSTWLYRIVVNHCLNHNSKQKKNVISLNQIGECEGIDGSLPAYRERDKKLQIEQIQKALAELPDRQRFALVLAHYEDKSHEEIAEIMKISLPAVHSLIFRARCALKKKLRRLLG